MLEKITEEDIKHWEYNYVASYLVEILNYEYSIEDARNDALSFREIEKDD